MRRHPGRFIESTTIVAGSVNVLGGAYHLPGAAARSARAPCLAHVRGDRRRPDGGDQRRPRAARHHPRRLPGVRVPVRGRRTAGCAWSISLPPCICRRADSPGDSTGSLVDGYVDRVPSLQDRRVMLAVLTDSGFAKLTEAYPTHLASVRRRIFDHCSSADVVRPRARVHGHPGRTLHDDRAAAGASAATSPTSASRMTTTTSSSSPPIDRCRRPACSPGAASPHRASSSSRANLADSTARAVVVVARNANVANGRARRCRQPGARGRRGRHVSAAPPTDVLIASTGVIGRRYPIERMLEGIAAMPAELPDTDIDRAAAAIMTTDTHPEGRRAHRRRKRRPDRRRWPRAPG